MARARGGGGGVVGFDAGGPLMPVAVVANMVERAGARAPGAGERGATHTRALAVLATIKARDAAAGEVAAARASLEKAVRERDRVSKERHFLQR